MNLEIVCACESIAALAADERSHLGVLQFGVPFQKSLQLERLFTNVADERTILRRVVGMFLTNVSAQIARLRASERTLRTRVRLLGRMDPSVDFQITRSRELLAAVGAIEWPQFQMHRIGVPFQVYFHRERLRADVAVDRGGRAIGRMFEPGVSDQRPGMFGRERALAARERSLRRMNRLVVLQVSLCVERSVALRAFVRT